MNHYGFNPSPASSLLTCLLEFCQTYISNKPNSVPVSVMTLKYWIKVMVIWPRCSLFCNLSWFVWAFINFIVLWAFYFAVVNVIFETQVKAKNNSHLSGIITHESNSACVILEYWMLFKTFLQMLYLKYALAVHLICVMCVPSLPIHVQSVIWNISIILISCSFLSAHFGCGSKCHFKLYIKCFFWVESLIQIPAHKLDVSLFNNKHCWRQKYII